MIEQPTTASLLTIGEFAKRSGLAPSALRFYEERGLIFSERNVSGHRRYLRSHLRRVAFIAFAQRVGYSLEEIRTELDKLPSDQVPTGEDWARLSQIWDGRIAQRINELERIKGQLTSCCGCGCLSLERCSMLNRADYAAHYGTGPRYWIGDESLPAEE